MAQRGTVAAVDLGATSGRVLLGHVGPRELHLSDVARFGNHPVRTADGLHWSILELYRVMVEGLAAAAREAPELASIGIDSWGCDYALLREGRMLGEPYAYRDERNLAAVELVHAAIPPEELYAANGLQHLPFNTLFQLTADRTAGQLQLADSFLLLPDLLAYWLTGTAVAERTNASTTGLLRGDFWRVGLRPSSNCLELRPELFRTLVDAGTDLGRAHGDGRSRRRSDRRARDDRRIARHGVRDRRDPGIRPRLRLHLLRHLVAGRRRTRAPRAERCEPPGRFHQRGRRRRARALPAQRHGALAAQRVRAGVGARRQQRHGAGAGGAGRGPRTGEALGAGLRCGR